ncbi:DNA translocase FtsK [Staphylococcus devriesei]|uniref:DNA translocase FtsK n=1 Tax=Staphylococcus devriesei TaxID=586733 RepID=A0A2K4DV76_9STAP|nr:DNA translocase FtsK [Staphylococcus devriesei]MCE5097640.1 DNA translocase FtsK [Staphylococcus devriesei]PNZ90692.1 DNA translocase FtsK [Staphylococcus devriesei]PTE73697.1 DNA translocase FtsK [Staphylococcus devriesei]PTF15293.1 DNA translocase FtsK [Staphylococcus devriesei]RIL74350.1 DNA translocase FtsK [Staphylococcus devriesei]
MSWFDDLFNDNNDSDEELLRRKNKRRQDSKMQDDDALLPENNDVYDRPKGKFRFPIDIGRDNEDYEDAIYYDSESKETDFTESHQHVDNNSYMSHYSSKDNGISYYNNDSNDTRRRRRRTHTNHDDTGIPSFKNRTPQSRTSSSRRSDYNTHTTSTSASKTKNTKHSGSSQNHNRFKLQSERFKSDYKMNSDFTYHRPSFKTSEVPSAIFGTKKRRPIENGVIPPVNDDVNSESTSSKKDNNETLSSHNYNYEKVNSQLKGDSTTSTQPDTSSKVGQHNDVNNETESSKSKTPSYSQRDNTVNIENIYASQIVEEIRRERERKAQQKRRFKQALQHKRQQVDEKEDGIQKAIDEMYAKQAQQYIGESSLDHDEDNESHFANEHENALGTDTEQFSENNQDENKQQDGEDDAHYNYEEVDLNQVTSLQRVNDEDVKVSDVDASKVANENHEEYHSNETSDQMSNDDDLDVMGATDYDNETNQYVQSYNDIDEANYREIENSEENEYKDVDIQSHPSASDENIDFVLNAVESETEYAPKHHEDLNSQEQAAVAKDRHQPKHDVDNREYHNEVEEEHAIDSDIKQATSIVEPNKEDSTSETSEETITNNSEDSTSNYVKDNENEIKEQTNTPKRNIKPGSRPFNVVMTPSDKKKMMDAKKDKRTRSKVDVPELKPETKFNSTHESTDIQSHLSPSTKDEDEHTASQSLNNEDNHLMDNDSNIIENHVEQEGNNEEETISDTIGQPHNEIEESHFQNESNETSINHSETGQYQQQDSGQTSSQTVAKNTIRKGPNIKLPSLDLLEAPEEYDVDETWIDEKKQELNDAFYYFNVPAEVQNVTRGPSVTRFELAVEKGVKVSRITALQDDIKMALAAKDIRIEAPIPGTSLVGIEVPNQNPTKVNLKSILETQKFKNADSKLTVAMGNRINNEPLLMDIAKTPHALIAGATGSGKSVCINSILMSLLYKNHPEELRLLLIDPKMVELAPYNDLPHLVSPVITDVKAATQSLKWAVDEMERRYKLFAQYHVRNITAFNKKASYEQRIPKIVIVIDELADLMMMAPQEVEQSIARIAQKARACGIHMLVATQRPSVNVITGLIKANIPTRIAFMVSSSVDSRTILDSGGAERLLGYGDMLYLGSGMNKPIRVQGTFVSDEEIDDVVDFIKEQREPNYLFEEKELLKKNQTQAQDELFNDVCEFMIQEGHISTSLIQRHFQIGYNRAARIVDQLEQLDYISGANGSKPRDVFITEADLQKD